VSKLEQAGFDVLHATSFVALLLPLMALSRLRRSVRGADRDPLAELRVAPGLNRVLEGVLNVELLLTSRRLSWPAGGSLLVVARRRSD
jgi:hypothetical protein